MENSTAGQRKTKTDVPQLRIEKSSTRDGCG